MTDTETQDENNQIASAADLPEGDYAIVEALGHRTYIGRVTEVERFGTTMLQIEPLFGQTVLAPVLLGGGSIYQFTPCSRETAYERRATREYELPNSVRVTIPPIALPPAEEPSSEEDSYDGPSFAEDERDW